MKAKVLLLAALLPLGAIAAPGTGAIEIDCVNPTLPPQREVAAFLGIDNLGHAYARRARLMVNASRTCKQLDADSLLLVAGPVARNGERTVVMLTRR
jgi:hypothetical protein